MESTSNNKPEYGWVVQLCFLFLTHSVLCYGLEGLLHVDSLLRGCLKIRNVALGLAPRHCPFL